MNDGVKTNVFSTSPLRGGLGATYDVHLMLIEKRVDDFLFFAKCYG